MYIREVPTKQKHPMFPDRNGQSCKDAAFLQINLQIQCYPN